MRLDRLAGSDLEKVYVFVSHFIREKLQKLFGEAAARNPQAEHQTGIFLRITSKSSGNPFKCRTVKFPCFKGKSALFKGINFLAELVFQFL